MRHDYVTMFLDAMDYLNSNAQTIGAKNIKELCYRAIDYGFLKQDQMTRKFIYFCNKRNDIAHGGARFANEITRDVLFEVYLLGIMLLFRFSKDWDVEAKSDDIYCYYRGELKIKYSKLVKKVKSENALLFIDFYR